MAEEWLVWVVLLGSSFIPPVIWMLIIRNTERYGREPMGQVLRAFLWGAGVAVIVAIVLSLLLLYLLETRVTPLYEFVGRRFSDPGLIIGAVIVAPLVEEFAKALAVLRVRRHIDEPEDGLVYGASAGLGFAATENLFYGLAALLATGSLTVSLVLIGIRSVSSALLHATATASTGYGLAKRRIWRESALPGFVIAVGLHAAFNLFASIGVLYESTLGDAGAYLGLGVAVGFGVLGFALIRQKIREKDSGLPSRRMPSRPT